MKHLNKEAVKILEATDDERIAYILQPKWIGFPLVKQTLTQMEDLFLHPTIHRMPNLLIKAQSNNGKSHLLNRFLKLHPVYEDLQERNVVIPVVFIEIPPDPKPETIYTEILRYLKLPFRESYSKDRKFNMVKSGFERLGVRMLCIDEMHVLMNTTRLKKAQLLDAIKHISNQTRIPIVAAGTYEAHTALVSDVQLANRFNVVELPQWRLNDEFRQLLASFETVIPLKERSDLDQVDMTTRIYGMSEGWIGEVHAVLALAAKYAIQHQEESITLETLDRIHWSTPQARRTV